MDIIDNPTRKLNESQVANNVYNAIHILF